ncbi:MAG TPA: phosphotransferase [Propioniciclava tarda]|nr:phosphotransferase [Propioniciclava tarda]HQA30268.1 phosphotransferase [Propioniciclava tarda]HQD60073.1 phosphotransferase [Propioniciclava tarda]
MTLASAWWDYLQTVRWFGGKGRDGRVSKLERLPAYTAPGVVPAVESFVATIDYTDGGREFYHLLAATYPEADAPVPPIRVACGHATIEAAADPRAIQVLVEALYGSTRAMRWQHAPGKPGAASVMRGEQSNTNVTVGADAILKIFRKIEPGPNLDAEVLAALDDTGCAVPALFGRLVAEWPTGHATDLGMVIERLTGVRDGWEFATEACAADQDFSAEAHALGAELARVHAALAEKFATSTASGDDLANEMTRRLDAAVAAAPALAPYRDALASEFDTLRSADLAVQRVHGDFHLGQTLHSPNGWTIIDFEGEPAKSAAERRAPDSVWRDVAGMLRSFDYARSAHAEPLGDSARNWTRQAQTALCEGYCGATEAPRALLSAYEADKAAYEVVYETRNRPDWVTIPLGAVALLATSAKE